MRNGDEPNTEPALPVVEARRRLRPSPIWLIPLLAVLIAGWLVWTHYAAKGPTVVVRFRSAEGIEPGKTRVRFREVEVGKVRSVQISEDLSRVLVTLELVRGAERLLAADSRFWIVTPRIGFGGISGLQALVSGSYIEVDPGSGQGPVYRFDGLDEPPLIRSDVPGTRFVLEAERLGGVGRGSPVFFRDIEVGQVLGWRLAPEGQRIDVFVFVRRPYDRLVHPNSRFWNASGVEFGAGSEGLYVRMRSLRTLLTGAIAFDSPPGGERERPASPGMRFALFDSRRSLLEARYTRVERYRAYFEGSVRGLRPGAAVEFRGIRVGRVADVRLVYDVARAHLSVPVTLEIQPERFTVIGREVTEPYLDMDSMAALVARGLRARVATANILTGESLVELEFVRDAPPAELGFDDEYPVIPTVPSQFEAIAASLRGVLRKIEALPLEALVNEMTRTIRDLDAVIAGPDAARTLSSLRRAAESFARAADTLERGAEPALVEFRRALAQTKQAADEAERTFRALRSTLQPGSRMYDETLQVLRELRAAARAIRLFAEYLERNPQALLRGKGP